MTSGKVNHKNLFFFSVILIKDFILPSLLFKQSQQISTKYGLINTHEGKNLRVDIKIAMCILIILEPLLKNKEYRTLDASKNSLPLT